MSLWQLTSDMTTHTYNFFRKIFSFGNTDRILPGFTFTLHFTFNYKFGFTIDKKIRVLSAIRLYCKRSTLVHVLSIFLPLPFATQPWIKFLFLFFANDPSSIQFFWTQINLHVCTLCRADRVMVMFQRWLDNLSKFSVIDEFIEIQILLKPNHGRIERIEKFQR